MIFIKKRKTTTRNYDDPAYKKWRKDVARRDGYKCQWPKCGCDKHLRFHHIRRWADYPALRFEIDNGITLCNKHHNAIWGKEQDFERLFYTLVAQIKKKNLSCPKKPKKKK